MFWISWLVCFASRKLYVTGNETTTLNSGTLNTTTTTTVEISERSDDHTEEPDKTQSDLDLETQDQVAILKQINRVNDDGSYTFGYEAADGSFKIETRDVNGNVKGMFGFINEDGELKRVSYSASNGTGFQSTGTLNIPPLPGTGLSSEEGINPNYNGDRFNQENNFKPKGLDESSTKISFVDSTTPVYESSPDTQPSKLPVYIFGSSTSSSPVTVTSKPVVIQHIPKVRPTPGSSSTIPTESEEILLKPLLSDLAPKRTSNTNFISFDNNDDTSESTLPEENSDNQSVIQVIRPRPGPFKKVIVTKRPVVATTPKVVTTTEYKSKDYVEKIKNEDSSTEGENGVRRQLGVTDNYLTTTTSNLATSGTEDSPDVYGGKQVTRPYPSTAFRTLFTQIPQHQRILQNSYIQNRNNYISAALGNPGLLPTPAPPQVVPLTTQAPNQQKTFPPSTPPEERDNTPTPIPQTIPGIQGQRQFILPPNFVGQYTPTVPSVGSYQQEQLPQQIFIPPALLDYLIRMLIIAQQRLLSQQRQQAINPYQHGVFTTVGPNNVPPEVINNQYDPRYYQPNKITYSNYSPALNGYSNTIPPRNTPDAQYPLPYYQAYPSFDPRYNYQSQMFSPLPYNRYQPRTLPYEVDSIRQPQNDEYMLRMLLDYSKYQAQTPLPIVQSTSTVVERSSSPYTIGRDSTTSSSTTPTPKVNPVRNVEILGQINEESQNINNYESSTKSEK